jgi:putative membrane protein
MNFDFFGEHPSVPIGCALLAVVYCSAGWLARRRPGRRQAAWFALALLVILFTHTAIDEFADDRIFFMHMLQHLLQTFIVPPLLLLGTPDWMLRPWVMSRSVRPFARFFTNPLVAFFLFSAVFVTAHFPAVFDLMCRNQDFHIFLHLCFMVSGVLMWWPLLSPLPEMPRLSYPAQVMYVFLLLIPMTAVAAPITLASQVIYPWYLEGPHGWGLRPMDDQILGGLLMWIGQGTYLMGVFTAIFYRWSRQEDQDAPVLSESPSPPLRVVGQGRTASA